MPNNEKSGRPKAGTAAAAIEAIESDELEMATVEWRGHEFTYPAKVEDWNVDALEAFEAGKAVTAVHAVLGDDQWGRFKRISHGTVREVTEVFQAIAKALGFEEAGE